MSDEARTIYQEKRPARGTDPADDVKGVLERMQMLAAEHLADVIAACPGTCLVLEGVSRAFRPGSPSFAITIEIKRLPDGEPAA